MELQQNYTEEDFFLKSINVEKIFDVIERTDYFFLYNIRQCREYSELEEGVYLSELAEYMDISIPNTSKAVKGLEDKGYVVWKTDEMKERTYIVLTSKAIELMRGQKRRMMDCYEKIITNIREEDLDVMMRTLNRIRELVAEK